MKHNELTYTIIQTAIEIHKELGPGLFESVYEEVMYIELTAKGLFVERQKAIPVFWKGIEIETSFRADLVVENKVIVELKSVEELHKLNFKQVQNQLKISKLKVGLLINFNEVLLKDGIHRIVNGYEDESGI